MAFHDIIQALGADTDAAIAAARAKNERELEAMREKTNLSKVDRIAHIERERDRKMKNMERQILAHAQMSGRQAAMSAKHALMGKAYDAALEKLAALSPKQTEELLGKLIDACPADGTLRPTPVHAAIIKKLAGNRTIGDTVKAAGGFVYESDRADRDCTYEALVRDILRPATELDVAGILFATAA